MEYTERCVAVSEPNALDVVIKQYRKSGDSSELRQLTRDVIRWECRSYPTIQPPPLGYFLKLQGAGIVVLPLLRYRCISIASRLQQQLNHIHRVPKLATPLQIS